jgi:hypothetical protein
MKTHQLSEKIALIGFIFSIFSLAFIQEKKMQVKKEPLTNNKLGTEVKTCLPSSAKGKVIVFGSKAGNKTLSANINNTTTR